MALGIVGRLGARVLPRALQAIRGLGGKGVAAAAKAKPYTGLVGGARGRQVAQAAANTASTAAKTATAAGSGRVIHPLGMLASGAKTTAKGLGVVSLAGMGAGTLGSAYNYIDPNSVGEDKVGDLSKDGTKFKGDLSVGDQIRLRLGGLFHNGDLGGVFTGPNAALQKTVLDVAQAERDDILNETYAADIARAGRGLGGLKADVKRGQSFVGMDEQMIADAIQGDVDKGTMRTNLINTEGGHEVLMGLDKNTDLGGLQSAIVNLNKTNREKQEAKEKKELIRQEERVDDANRIERERQDANTRLQLLLGDRADKRAEAKERRLREDKQYYDMLDRKERRAQREDARIRSERQSQQEMISLLLGGLNNL